MQDEGQQREDDGRQAPLFARTDLNASFSKGLSKLEWKESRTSYWVTDDYNLIRKTLHMAPKEQKAEIEAAGKKAIFSYNQTDFVRDRVAIEANSESTASSRMTCS